MSTGGAVLRQSRFMTFDGAVSVVTAHQRPDRYRHLEADLGTRKRIARGAGLSYAAASFGADVVVQEMGAFDRLLGYDEAKRALRVEAGASLDRVLGWAQGVGLRMPVVPGYPAITVGGCIAADAHGKNPSGDGTFCEWVDAITLFHPARGFRTVSRESDAEAFEATCGGFGLTGVIVDATLRLAPPGGRSVVLESFATGSLEEAAARLAESRGADFAYSWHDGSARGAGWGRGLVVIGRWSDEHSATASRAYMPMSAADRAAWPVALWNGPSVRLANSLYRRMALAGGRRVESAFEADFPFARRTIYHRMYGRRGLAEMQLLVPADRLSGFLAELRSLVEKIDPPLVMMSMKRFRGRARSLSMSGEGMLVALDLARSEATARFAQQLDELTASAGAQPNIAKDSRLPAAVAARTLPHFAAFAARVRRLDPERLYASELSRRLEL